MEAEASYQHGVVHRSPFGGGSNRQAFSGGSGRRALGGSGFAKPRNEADDLQPRECVQVWIGYTVTFGQGQGSTDHGVSEWFK